MIDPQAFVFYVVAGLTAACALATVVSQNIVRSATWLLFTLVGAAGVFFILGADFVGAIQILIYVGGTMVLVVFGVMLTAQGPFISMKTSGAEWAISIVAGILLFTVLFYGSWATYQGKRTEKAGGPTGTGLTNPAGSHQSVTIGEVLMGAPFGANTTPKSDTDGSGSIEGPGAHYLLPFEIVSIHLLVVLIGAAYLARAKRRRGETA
jgi:NADH-quinone oxidoreductase subunit J